jgi:hypothetical protein
MFLPRKYSFLAYELKYTLAAYEHTTRGIQMFLGRTSTKGAADSFVIHPTSSSFRN